SYERLSKLSLRQDDLLRQSLRCIEVSVYRAAHVLSWAAMADYLIEYALADGGQAIRLVRPKWKFADRIEVEETHGEFAIIEAMRAASLLQKTEAKSLHGLLSKRNECAHPTSYLPGMNEALGFVSEILNRLETLERRINL
ncbi:MAG: hypothetical protein AAF141_09520, partial [Pseudomonadota bacterium]